MAGHLGLEAREMLPDSTVTAKDTFTDLSGLITLIVVSLTATAAAAVMDRSRSEQPQKRLRHSST